MYILLRYTYFKKNFLIFPDLGVVKYNVKVVTGNEFSCGTNANVFITLYGSFEDSGKTTAHSEKSGFIRAQSNRRISDRGC